MTREWQTGGGPGRLLSAAAGLLVLSATSRGAEGTVRFDFESGDLQGWKVVEGKFDRFVCDRADFHHGQGKYNKQGKYFLSTLDRRDNQPDDSFTGVAESPVFVLSGPDMTLLVGGGGHSDTYVALCSFSSTRGREVLTARGKNAQDMQRVTWRAPKLVGKKVFLRLVDRNSGGWGHITFDDFTAKGRIDAKATKRNFAGAGSRLRAAKARASVGNVNMEALRSVVEDLTATFPERYKGYLERLDGHEKALAGDAGAAKPDEDIAEFYREALVANPLVSGQPILFVTRSQYRGDHHNTATMFQVGEVNTGKFRGPGALKTVDLAKGGQVRTLVESPKGVVRDQEVSFDGKRIVFSMRREKADDYHIYEVRADGTGLKALTRAKLVSDIDPLYLPDGSIVFSSTREPKFCMCNQHIMANLFRMDADGANIHQIGKSTLHEGHSSLTPDGRILYDRWEYVDRNFGDAQGLWTVNPDGTNHAVYWGNNTTSPGAVLDARVIPGTQKIICTLSSCHDRPWGALGIIDRRLGLDGRKPIVRTWPPSAVNLAGRGNFDTYKRVKPKYEDPYPLSDKYFLCSRLTGKGEQMGIYLLDLFGNEILLHAEGAGCYDPMPLAPRGRPLAIPVHRDFANGEGTFYLLDVCAGHYMKGVEPGAVKFLRVIESPEKRFFTGPAWGGQGVHKPGMNWHNFENKRILGTVPVEADGSAHFSVPADKFIFFQALDENGMMINSMRSGTIAQSGETLGCIGCHESKLSTPPSAPGRMPLALARPPSKMNGWYGEPRLFSFQAEVQPVFDKHCVKCHDFGKKGAKKLILAGDRDNTFCASYVDLWYKKYIKCVGAGPSETQQAYSWGSHPSRLVQTLRKGHPSRASGSLKGPNDNKVKLTKEEMDRIVTWVDLNGPYYPIYASAYPKGISGRSPLDGKETGRLGKLTGVNLGRLANHGRRVGSQVSFDRPSLSPCLAKLDKNGAKYKEALAIVRAGRDRLRKRPRADMPGFKACEVDSRRQERYALRQEAERRSREAIRKGGKVYDERR